ncbi:MAG: hypothetical protein R2911_41070 [Caldilineaceae bacterium]
MIITTRIDPPLPLARWRVRGQLAEITPTICALARPRPPTFSIK